MRNEYSLAGKRGAFVASTDEVHRPPRLHWLESDRSSEQPGLRPGWGQAAAELALSGHMPQGYPILPLSRSRLCCINSHYSWTLLTGVIFTAPSMEWVAHVYPYLAVWPDADPEVSEPLLGVANTSTWPHMVVICFLGWNDILPFLVVVLVMIMGNRTKTETNDGYVAGRRLWSVSPFPGPASVFFDHQLCREVNWTKVGLGERDVAM